MKITKIPVAYRKLISDGLTHRISMWRGSYDYSISRFYRIRDFLQDNYTSGWKLGAIKKENRSISIYINEEILTLLLLNGMNNED